MSELKSDKFKAFGLQATEEGFHLVKLTIEDGEITEVESNSEPMPRSVAIEKLKLEVAKIVLNLGNQSLNQ